MNFLRKYGVATAAGTHVRIPIIKAGSQDYAGSGDWTPAAGDVKISKNGGAQANIGTLPTYTNGAWQFQFTAAELQAATIEVQVVDSATKAIEDQFFIIETYGHASALHAMDFDDSVRGGLTALPNAAADAAGGLPISDAGGLDLDTLLAELAAANIPADIDTLIARLTAARAGYLDELAAANLPADIDTLIARLTAARAGYLDELAAANIPADIDTLIARLTATRAGYLDKLNITGNVASSGEVTAIQNNTRVRVVVPPAMERPDSGSTAFKLHLYIYDDAGNMEAPDSAPTIAAANQSGTDRSANLGTVTLENTGHYSVTYTVNTAHAIEQILFEWTIVEGGATRLHGAATQIVDTTAVDFTAADRAKLDTLHDSRLTAARAGYLDNLNGHTPQSGDSYAIVNHGTYGNAQLARTSALPINFGDLAITPTTGRVTVGTNLDKTGYDLNADQSTVTIGTVTTNSDMRGTDNAATAAALAAAQADITAIKANTDNLPSGIKKNAQLSNFTFFMRDSTDHVTGKTGLTVTAERSLDGADFAACANAVVEIANGLYKITLAAADLNADVVTLKFTAAGADATIITIITEP